MLMPLRPSPDERGKYWLQTQVQQLLAASAVALAPPRAGDDSACNWGTGPETGTTLYLRLAGDPEPHALRFQPALLRDCGAGQYARQTQAILFIRRMLKKMGILSG
jgi:hypothetical protein